ncbi:MAG: hypothetical protein HYU77_07475 [Betaproteobacteria bacterium]|nr:hypothetical protein [Betaproteobacteria bacterium]
MERKHWLVRPATIRHLWRVFIAVLGATVALEFLFPITGHFGLDGSFGFHAWFGFVACAVLILFAKLLGVFFKRKDTYYDR